MAVAVPHILVFSLAYDPYWGGAEIALKEIMRLLPRFHFTVITARALKHFPAHDLKEIEEQGNVRIVRVGAKSRWRGQYGYPFAAVKRAFAEARFQRPDAVWGMMESYGGMAASLFHQKFNDIPYLLTMQSGDSEAFWALRTWFWKPWYQKIFTHASAIQAISGYLAERAQAFGARGPIEVIPNGVAEAFFAAPISQEERNALREQWGVEAEGKAIITVSRLVEKNGVDTLIQGYALWRRQYAHPASRLVIAGRGPQGARLKKLAAREGVEKEVRFLGEVPNEILPRYYQSADVFARPSRSEGLGISFLEALAAGMPLIGTAVGGIPDFLKDGETGLAVRPNDADGIASAIEQITGNENLRARLAENGKRMARERYTWDQIAERIGILFDQLITESHARIH
ncbi:hypothetical protein A3J43_00090 [Candidatus Uhrbacteria bacterium RIFCSPHIGHO2_12_FULL_54_23]|uniref:Glycosyl transferase family 1 domain-containing protein n=2 Tax=Candidatus Uhriibacteriota TaxID=1752732 RepID=A0A1F7UFW6_9BACT|nr:MAG: Glycosyltransferase [Parcubacteria group bacterium GW2011_GWC2_45_7]OGL77170.1 MAG: hypothetical protein A3J43_00090 [Candidatus Uhrbacteria bacterium RIFCSPHIGHO2_12_FULL_54_23]OGL90087.1 MAG: hypothetical protein A3J36_01405 [Candidatus Uhrbacteria bacterium RIFCSPLOWO2_02_FULL_54_37]